ncbi:hypothetical protein ZWY2020_020581 [Hordeum vulgare]|nr:hypothetical protein ZWY2020_020581 [Hordeum vulgare]
MDRDDVLRAELVAHPPTAARVRDGQTPREPVSRVTATRPSEPDWRRGRGGSSREDRRDATGLLREAYRRPTHEVGRRPDWRPSRAHGAEWRLDDWSPGRRSSGHRSRGVGRRLPRRRRSLRRRRLLEGLLEWLAVRLRWGFLSRWLRSPSPPSAWASGQCSREDKMCINHGCAGNFRSESEAPPQCPTTISYLGYRTERGSGYFVDAKIEEEVSQPHLASVTLAPEQVLPPGLVISADLIQVELAAYIGDFGDSEFTWEVTEMAPLVFSVPFPSTEMLWVSSHDFIRCPTNKFLISVHAAVAEPELVPPLERLWVLVYGLPRGGLGAPRAGKLTHILKAISEPVGKRVTADLASFEDDGPARIEILCPAPAEIDGMSLIFYFGSRGQHLTFELESPTAADLHGSIPDATLPRDDGRDGDGGSSKESSFGEEDDGDGGVPPPLDGRRFLSPLSCPSGNAGVASRVAFGTGSMVLDGPSHVVTSLVILDGVEVLGGSSPVATTAVDLDITEADILCVGMDVYASSSPRSPGVVCYSRSPGSHSPALGSPDRAPPRLCPARPRGCL